MSPAIRDSRMQTCLQPSWPGCAQEVVGPERVLQALQPQQKRGGGDPLRRTRLTIILVAVVKAALDHLSGQQKRHQSHQ